MSSVRLDWTYGGKTSGRASDWTQRRKERFFEHLMQSCDPEAACMAVRMTIKSLFALIRGNVAFRDEWESTTDLLYMRMEMGLLRIALGRVPVPEGMSAEKAAVSQRELAQKLLVLREARKKVLAARGTRGRAAHVRRATPEETDAAIMKGLASIKSRFPVPGMTAPAKPGDVWVVDDDGKMHRRETRAGETRVVETRASETPRAIPMGGPSLKRQP